MAFSVSSNSFKDGDYLRGDFILSADFGFGCAGGNKSPHLKWSGAPEGTRSFAVTCYDPDAPTGSGFWHWLLVNIPATVSELAEGAGSTGGKLAAGALQTRTDFGAPGYGGPCPPQGDHPHRYLFTGVIAIVVWLVQWASDYKRSRTALDILNERLARGEIDRDEYEEKRNLIGGG
jgi:Raf kinase inhibitor-like YbhB/YbcL family protein